MPTLGSGSNDFVPFATGVGAAVETPANWAADTVRQQGFQVGVADPIQANTALRQACFIATMIAQFSADYSGVASLDNGNVTTAETNFINALATAFQPFGVYFLADDGSGGVNQMVASPVSPTNPTTYTGVRLVVIRKAAGANTGPMQVNYWGLGLVQLNDNAGSPLGGGVALGNSYYLQTFDGGAFRQLGGVSTTAGAGGVLANSGDAISVVVPNSTVTLTLASPGVVNWTAHGLAANTAVQFATTGALPTGLTPFTTYYVLSPATNTFQVSATPGGAAINFTGSQSGTHTCQAIGAATVNWRPFLGTHDLTVGSGDAWGRGKASDGTARYMTTSEMLAWLNGALTFPSVPTPFGTGVGQSLILNISVAGAGSPSVAGFSLGNTYPASQLISGAFGGTNANLLGVAGVNGSNTGIWASTFTPPTAAIYGSVTGTWRLVGWFNDEGWIGWGNYSLIFTRIL